MRKRPAVFLDRDGTIIQQIEEIIKPSQMKILKRAPAGLKLLHELGFLTIVITNQVIVGKGLITRTGVKKLHKILAGRLARKGGHIDAWYFCPHRYWDHCPCRKPNIGMIKDAVKKHHINLSKSFLIGDHLRDIETGRRAKLPTILVKTGYGGKDRQHFQTKPDYTTKDLLSAAQLIEKLSHRKTKK